MLLIFSKDELIFLKLFLFLYEKFLNENQDRLGSRPGYLHKQLGKNLVKLKKIARQTSNYLAIISKVNL